MLLCQRRNAASPELEGKPLAVGTVIQKQGHGIVLTANYIAKKCGDKNQEWHLAGKTGLSGNHFVPPRMDLYLRFSSMAREIYSEYTDIIEPYGIDEGWLDVTESSSIKGDGMKIAQEISDRIKYELGITVSIGISWNKIFAKLGSDYKKPDAITQFHRGNYKEIVWGASSVRFTVCWQADKQEIAKTGDPYHWSAGTDR